MKWITLLFVLVFETTLCMAHSDNFIESDLFGNLGERDKAAILVVHFGTTHDDTRALTIDAINAKMKEAFPSIEVRSLDLPDNPEDIERTGSRAAESDLGTYSIA